jgi:uncharacterized coiled-coil DUF342 family protein
VDASFWLQVAIWVIGVGIFIAANAYKFGQIEAKLASKEEVKNKTDRIYERFDVHKKLMEDNFVRRDMCGQMHLTAKDEVKRIDDEYKNFRHEIRNQFQQIMDKMDELQRQVNAIGK